MEIQTNTTNKSYTRYNYGVVYLKHKGREVTTSVGSEYDSLLFQLNSVESRAGRIPPMFKERPDIISDVFYDTPGYWWYPMQFNCYFDPFENLQAGANISIPDLQ